MTAPGAPEIGNVGMITRIAMFEGAIKSGLETKFREDVVSTLVPLWTRFAGAEDIRVMFTDECDPGAPAFPMILAISYQDVAAMNRAMESPARLKLREVIGDFLARYFEGEVHHHTTQLNAYVPVDTQVANG